MNHLHELPWPGEIEEARRNPNGWVYRIAGRFDEDEQVPPEAIVGAWRVDANGEIVGKLERNENYNPRMWPGPL